MTIFKIIGLLTAIAWGVIVSIIAGVLKRPVMAGVLVVALIVGYAKGDGTIATPPPCEQPTTWKIVYNHENAPADGTPANAIVRVAYISSTDKVLDTEDINLTGSDFTAFIAAQASPASGEVGGCGSGRKKLFRMSTWLITNGKLSKCPSCVTVG